jgi:hypothetical protein
MKGNQWLPLPISNFSPLTKRDSSPRFGGRRRIVAWAIHTPLNL